MSLDEGFIDHCEYHLSPITGTPSLPLLSALSALSVLSPNIPLCLLHIFTAKYFYQNTRQQEDEQVVALIKILQDEVNAGFHHVHANQIVSFNGEKITNLKQLIEKVENCKEPFLDFKLDSSERIILDTQKAKKATDRILRRYGIRNSKSEGLMMKQGKKEKSEIEVDKEEEEDTNGGKKKKKTTSQEKHKKE